INKWHRKSFVEFPRCEVTGTSVWRIFVFMVFGFSSAWRFLKIRRIAYGLGCLSMHEGVLTRPSEPHGCYFAILLFGIRHSFCVLAKFYLSAHLLDLGGLLSKLRIEKLHCFLLLSDERRLACHFGV